MEEHIHYHGRSEIEGQYLVQFPAVLKCRTCARVLLRTKKDYRRKHLSIDVITTTPPIFMHDGSVVCYVCDQCSSRTLIRVRS